MGLQSSQFVGEESFGDLDLPPVRDRGGRQRAVQLEGDPVDAVADRIGRALVSLGNGGIAPEADENGAQALLDGANGIVRGTRESAMSRPAVGTTPGPVASGPSVGMVATAASGATSAARFGGGRRVAAGLAAVVLIAASVAFMVSKRAPALTERDTILLADFVNTTGDPVFDETLKPALAGQLEQTPFLNVFGEERARQTRRLMGRSPDQRVTGAVARELCVHEGIKAVLTLTSASDAPPP